MTITLGDACKVREDGFELGALVGREESGGGEEATDAREDRLHRLDELALGRWPRPQSRLLPAPPQVDGKTKEWEKKQERGRDLDWERLTGVSAASWGTLERSSSSHVPRIPSSPPPSPSTKEAMRVAAVGGGTATSSLHCGACHKPILSILSL